MASMSERTYYQYQLLRKIRFTPLYNAIYLFLGIVSLGAAIWSDGISGVLYVLLAWGLLLWLHYVSSRTIFLMDQYTYRKRWGFRSKLPWIGFLPLDQQYVGYRYWKRINLLIFHITFLIIIVLIPFVPIGLALQFIFWHIWISGPRLYSMITAAMIREEKLIKLDNSEFLIYKA